MSITTDSDKYETLKWKKWLQDYTDTGFYSYLIQN
jgi:hypothetical protein